MEFHNFHMDFTPYPMNHGMSWLGKMPSIGSLDMKRLGEIKFLFEYPRFGGIRRGVKGQNALRGEY